MSTLACREHVARLLFNCPHPSFTKLFRYDRRNGTWTRYFECLGQWTPIRHMHVIDGIRDFIVRHCDQLISIDNDNPAVLSVLTDAGVMADVVAELTQLFLNEPLPLSAFTSTRCSAAEITKTLTFSSTRPFSIIRIREGPAQ